MRPVVVSKKPAWIALAAVLAFNGLLVSLQHTRHVDSGFIRLKLLDSLAPVAKLVDSGFDGTGSIWHGYFALVGVQDENRALRSEIDALRLQLAEQQEEVLEAERLRKLLDLQDQVGREVVAARVISRDPSRFHETVTIDKGQLHGVRPNTAITTPAGVVGRVIHSADRYSVVQLVADAQSAVAVMVRSSRQQGIVQGTGSMTLELDYVDGDSPLIVGDELITSGMDRIYPKGLFVGVITSMGPESGLFRTMMVRPGANLASLEEVLCVIEPFPDSEESPGMASVAAPSGSP